MRTRAPGLALPLYRIVAGPLPISEFAPSNIIGQAEEANVTFKSRPTSAHSTIALLAALLFSLAYLAEAAPPLTRIQDQLFRADGTPINGTLVISWKTFTASDSTSIPANSLRVPVSAGLLRVRLTPTTTALTKANYCVQYLVDGKLTMTEIWAVPPSTVPLDVKSVRLSANSDGGGVSVTGGTPILLSDVTGLTDALATRPTKGAGYLTGRVLVPDVNGELSGLNGSAAQCVHGDGSLGSCGQDPITFVDLETPAGTLDGINATFVLSGTPLPSTSLLLFRNGLLQRPGTDFVLTGATVYFSAGSVPQPGDSLQASYRILQ